MNNWISVKDRLPEAEKEVLVLVIRKYYGGDYKLITTAIYEDGKVSTEDDEVTHWMPLPEIPEED